MMILVLVKERKSQNCYGKCHEISKGKADRVRIVEEFRNK